jgi:hypothetical protein
MRPTTCGNCGADLAKVEGRAEIWSDKEQVWSGLLDCPNCNASYVYIRPHERKRNGVQEKQP